MVWSTVKAIHTSLGCSELPHGYQHSPKQYVNESWCSYICSVTYMKSVYFKQESLKINKSILKCQKNTLIHYLQLSEENWDKNWGIKSVSLKNRISEIVKIKNITKVRRFMLKQYINFWRLTCNWFYSITVTCIKHIVLKYFVLYQEWHLKVGHSTASYLTHWLHQITMLS